MSDVRTIESPLLNDEPEFSYSQLNDYDQCGEKYRLRRVEHVPEFALGAAIAGKSVHATIEYAETLPGWTQRTSKAEIAALNAILGEHFNDAFLDALKAEERPVIWTGKKTEKFPYGETRPWWEQNGPRMLAKYATVRRDDHKLGVVMRDGGSEMHVRARAAGHLVQGYIDAALLVTQDGEQIVRDYKTGSTLSLKRLQLVMYGYLLRETVGIGVTWGEFIWLRGASPETIVKRYNIAPQIDTIPRLVDDHARSIRAGIYRMVPSDLCKTCTVKDSCAWGRTIEGS